jgi:hypothetical protein
VLPQSFFAVVAFCLVSALLCSIGALLTLFLQGSETALALVDAWVFKFNGILVGGTGYGLLYFLRRNGSAVLLQLTNILEIPPKFAPTLVLYSRRALSWRWCVAMSVPLTAAGAAILWQSGFPLHGFAKVYLAISTVSIYVVASCILTFLVFTLALFRFLEENSRRYLDDRFRTRSGSNYIELEALDSFFVISATMGLIAIYVGFRGTLTANFTDESDLYRRLFIAPIIFYLPVALLYSFYPRYVLRKIRERDILITLDEFGQRASDAKFDTVVAELECRKLLLELKEKLRAETSSTAILGFKDAPSLTISLLIAIQFLAQRDPAIAEFLRRLF